MLGSILVDDSSEAEREGNLYHQMSSGSSETNSNSDSSAQSLSGENNSNLESDQFMEVKQTDDKLQKIVNEVRRKNMTLSKDLNAVLDSNLLRLRTKARSTSDLAKGLGRPAAGNSIENLALHEEMSLPKSFISPVELRRSMSTLPTRVSSYKSLRNRRDPDSGKTCLPLRGKYHSMTDLDSKNKNGLVEETWSEESKSKLRHSDAGSDDQTRLSTGSEAVRVGEFTTAEVHLLASEEHAAVQQSDDTSADRSVAELHVTEVCCEGDVVDTPSYQSYPDSGSSEHGDTSSSSSESDSDQDENSNTDREEQMPPAVGEEAIRVDEFATNEVCLLVGQGHGSSSSVSDDADNRTRKICSKDVRRDEVMDITSSRSSSTSSTTEESVSAKSDQDEVLSDTGSSSQAHFSLGDEAVRVDEFAFSAVHLIPDRVTKESPSPSEEDSMGGSSGSNLPVSGSSRQESDSNQHESDSYQLVSGSNQQVSESSQQVSDSTVHSSSESSDEDEALRSAEHVYIELLKEEEKGTQPLATQIGRAHV